MRTRIKALVGVVIATAAIGGVLAAPAAASPPVFFVSASCDSANGPVAVRGIDVAGVAQRNAIVVLNQLLSEQNLQCLPGTREISVLRI
jgi:hypothetical protein